MSTTILQLQHSRFAHLAHAAVNALVRPLLRPLRQATAPVPALSRAAQAVVETRQAREMAMYYARTQPGFAADLRAAADRHELRFAE